MASTSDAHSLFFASPPKEQIKIAVRRRSKIAHSNLKPRVGSKLFFGSLRRLNLKWKSVDLSPNRVDQIYRSWDSSVAYGALLKIEFRLTQIRGSRAKSESFGGLLRAAIKIKGEVSCFSCCDEDDMHKATDNGGAYMMNLQQDSDKGGEAQTSKNASVQDTELNSTVEVGYGTGASVLGKEEKVGAVGGGRALIIKTTCRAGDFKRTICGLSLEKKNAIKDLEFGPLHKLGCCKLNRPLCQMLVDNFDVQSGHIKIHGHYICISEADFVRIMGVTYGEQPVDWLRNTDDQNIMQLIHLQF